MAKGIDLTGETLGRLYVVKKLKEKDVQGNFYFLCKCICGCKVKVIGAQLKRGNTKSCGCLQRDTVKNMATIHGMSNSPEFKTWCYILARIEYKKSYNYKWYGGRGITICGYFRSFTNFFNDLGKKPNKKYSIGRIDNNMHYSCGHCDECISNGWGKNCRWETEEQQKNNMSTNKKYMFKGKIRTMKEIGVILGIAPTTLRRRIYLGWSLERVFQEPLNI